MDVRYIILSLFFLVSCMPTATVSKGNLASTNPSGGAAGGSGTDNTFTPLAWNFLGSHADLITINVSNLNNAYVVGSRVENYLNQTENFNGANYCFVSRYNIGGVTHELRSRVVPVSYFDFNLRRTVKNFRVDFQDVTQYSRDLCSKTLRIPSSSNSNYILDTNSPAPSLRFYAPNEICPNCTSMLNANNVGIYKVVQVDPATTYLDKVPTALVNTDSLNLQIDPSFSLGGGAGTCSNNECQARGYDCCLENQCVNDGAPKPNAFLPQYSTLYQTVQILRQQNPLAYLNYPQIYYICGTSVPTTTGGSAGGTTGGSTGTTGSGGYDAAFELLKKDYSCIQNIKSQSDVSPFHNGIMTESYDPATDCLTGAGQTNLQMHYKNVMKRLYTTCGCNRTDLQDMINSCPNYDYQVTTWDTTTSPQTPARIDCYTPPVNTPAPTQQSVAVSSRSAPHRYFDNAGVEKQTPNGVQEGSAFEYLDDGNILPSQQPFSMNAILGQMSATLDKALPAKTVNVELDQIYFLSTTSGYYSPCPTCAKDSWLTSLTAFPASSTGVGLQAIGHTTERDAFSTNTTGGNYEDTIFGRACWLPPTMIPYTHVPAGTAKAQRESRLQKQAALFANGYQRDWFGFNKGALIGSFDGVTWFPIGKGRIVRSTSKKLFLAINAPFADLASSTTHVVNVEAYNGITQATQVDYDPQYHQYHPYQNEGGNCQKYHMCDTDTDCVTKLGWEYACADVTSLRTQWPKFNGEGNELANDSTGYIPLHQILLQKSYPSSSTKRCVYRGAGSICHTNSNSLAATDLNLRKVLTCAPNFYCANTTASVFNNKISRYAAPLEDIPVASNHIFGKDANVLGRPLDYIATNSLSGNVPAEQNAGSNLGICRPGKALPTVANQVTLSNPFTQHASADASKRTDFINQIASCNPTLFTTNRHTSCPVIGADGNYEMFSTLTLPAGYANRATNQNSCGLESLRTTASLTSSADTLLDFSPFKSIEAKPLNQQIILNPTFARDACLRRAGAVCHTDLDCSPNKKHAELAETSPLLSYFGNEAERSYYTEYLVCGQEDPKPFPSDTVAFKNYDMSKNRCCREVGSDLTTYTADIAQNTFVNTTTAAYNPSSAGLLMSLAPGVQPNNPKRYSRLATVEGLGTTKPILTANQDRVGNLLDNTKPNIMTPNQWKTLSEANSETCCGGGWIRKFSDGTNDWSRRDRVVLDVTNFRCINSRTPLITNPSDVVGNPPAMADNNALVANLSYYYSSTDAELLSSQDYGEYCQSSDVTKASCAQFPITDTSSDTYPAVAQNYTSTVLNTVLPNHGLGNSDYFFKPRSADSDSAIIVDYASTAVLARRHIAIRLPSYVTRQFDYAHTDTLVPDGFTSATMPIRMVNESNQGYICEKRTSFTPTSPSDSIGFVDFGTPKCYYNYNPATRILKVGANNTAAGGGFFNNKKVGIEFTFNTAGRSTVTRTNPGSNAFYLKRLGLLELSGIPQMSFEMLTCNDNADRVLQGIYSPSIETTSDFSDNAFSFVNALTGKRHTNSYGLQHEPVFSANDFKCCSPLGKTVANSNVCCSGYSITTSGNAKTCALPPGTDLMVYFNSFVSNEGRSTTSPGGGLTENDFEPQTGEPKLLAAVNDKIRSLGAAYCSSGKVRQGGAFGSFEIEPQGANTTVSDRIYGIVDSSNDIGQNSNAGATTTTGYQAFSNGFRWNHHLYCDD